MKVGLLCLFLISTFFACKSKITEHDEFIIQTSINMHNISATRKFKFDSIDNAAKERSKLLNYGTVTRDELNSYIQSVGKVFANRYNEPYDINKDRFLTMDMYIDYCKAHGYDPKEYVKFLN